MLYVHTYIGAFCTSCFWHWCLLCYSFYQTEPPENTTTVPPALYPDHGDGGLSIQTDNMDGGVPVLDIDDLVHWTHSLDKDTIENP